MADLITVPVSSFDATKLGVANFVRRTNEASFTLTYGGNPFILQIGTTTDPVKTYSGAQYWNQNIKKFESITGSKDFAFAYSGSVKNKKKIGGNLQLSLSLKDFETEGKQSYYTNKAFTAINEFLFTVLEHGTKIGDKQVKMFDVDIPRALLQRMTRTPYVEPEGEYDPQIRTRIRYQLKVGKDGVPTNDSLLETSVQAYDLKTSTEIEDAFTVLRPRAEGVWLIAFNAVEIGATEVSFSTELLKVKGTIVPTRYEVAQFVDEPAIKKVRTEETVATN